MKPLAELLRRESFTREELIRLLGLREPPELEQLYAAAREVKVRCVGEKVYLRGLVEFSNLCDRNCFYCGIRRDNPRPRRYRLTKDEVFEAARFSDRAGYGSVVLQSGECDDEPFIAFVEELLRGIKELSDGRLGITLSLGEQSRETYARWRAAGAHRYLLRIETSNPSLFRRLHPPEQRFDRRLACLDLLRSTGYQVGTGVMIGLPGQTLADLADDVLFFQQREIDMIGMGPFIPQADTPLAGAVPELAPTPAERLELGLVMIAVTRLALRDVNIAAATALQALDDVGRERGILAGANIVMPNVTPAPYRADYQLYDGKPCLEERSDECRDCLARRLESIGVSIGYREWGDSPHFNRRER